MSRYRFSYLTLRGKHYPLIPIRLRYGDNAIKTYALVDSGSTLSVFRAEIADSLGMRLEDGEKIALQSANAPLTVYAHRLQAAVEGETFELRVGFSRDLLTSFNILGREGFFERFRITFNERKLELIIET